MGMWLTSFMYINSQTLVDFLSEPTPALVIDGLKEVNDAKQTILSRQEYDILPEKQVGSLGESIDRNTKTLDIADIEEQIMQDDEVAKLLKEPFVREINVEIEDSLGSNAEPVEEPLIVKKKIHKLEPVEVPASGHVAPRESTQETIEKNPSQKYKDDLPKAASSSAPPSKDVKTKVPHVPDVTSSVVDDHVKKTDDRTDKDSKKTRRRKRNEPPSVVEIQKQQSLIDRGERLMEAVLELSPGHSVVDELRPHLDGAKRDLSSNKLNGLEETTKQVVLILEDIYVRLVDEKVRNTNVRLFSSSLVLL